MRRTQSTDDSQAVSLFPFLAVLLSTMGALLIVLVAMTRLARLEAAQDVASGNVATSEAPPSAHPQTDQPTQEDAAGMEKAVARLRAIREAGLGELEDSRQRLRHADHHLRQLQDQVANLYREARALNDLKTNRLEDREQAQRELERLAELVRQTEARVEQERQESASTPKSFAIIPYQGAHGTKRRPLYIECRRDAVVLQPEGIELTIRDFTGPLGPGNPLASALRAAEDYYAENLSRETLQQQPYPLVLVRPDGVAAYYYVQQALQGWGSDFGYELLNGDWNLDFPLPNPQLANAQQQAIDLARSRQRALALAAPRRYGGGPGAGGRLEQAEENGFGSIASGSFIDLTGDALPFGDGDSPAAQETHRDRYAAGAVNQPSESSPVSGSNSGDESPVGTSGATDVTTSTSGPDQESIASNASTAAARGTSEQPTHSLAGASHVVPPVDGSPAGISGNSSRASSGESAGSAVAGQRTGDATLDPGHSNSPNWSAPGRQVSKARGPNWAVPEAGSGAVPVRRAIHVIIRQDQLAILPEQGAGGGRAIPIPRSVGAAVDSFVHAVQQHIRTWGTAGRGLYWQPILVLKAGPDGRGHAAALKQLLAGSGLEIAP